MNGTDYTKYWKISSADIKLDGITVICGENNSGKSTIGKILFSYFNSMCDFQTKIDKQKRQAVASYFSKNFMNSDVLFFPQDFIEELFLFIDSLKGEYTNEDIFEFLQKFPFK
ncbi:MAG: hypothetical protein IJJ69_13170, partial [Oscillospiraceae bacterium]|nr:hypothetical protein [Oscillospiraceae bacterium]